MWLLLITNRVLMVLSGLLVLAWTYYEGAQVSFVNELKPFYFPAVWGGTAVLVLLRCLRVERSIGGAPRLSLRLGTGAYTLSALAFLCAFTHHALTAVTLEFDTAHLNMPFFLPALFLPVHFIAAAWLLFGRRGPPADRGLLLIVFYYALNGAVFNTEFFILFGFTCITVLEQVIEHRERLRRPPPGLLWPVLLLLGWAVYATHEAVDPMKAVRALLQTGVCAAVCLLAAARPVEERLHWRLLFSLLLGGFLTAVSAVILLVVTGRLLGAPAVLGTRLTIFYQHPNFLAPYLAMLLVLAPAYGFLRRRGPDGWAALASVPVFAGLLVLTDSRAGYLGAAGGAILLALPATPLRSLPGRAWRRLSERSRRRLLLAVFLLSLALVGGVWIGARPLGRAVMESTRIRRSLDYRLDAWTNSLEIIAAHPLHGVGMNTFLSLKKFPPGSKFAHERSAPHPHDLFLYVAQSLGIPALLLFLLLLGGFFRSALSLVFGNGTTEAERRGRALAAACLPAAAVLLVCGLLDLGLSLETLFPGPLWIFLGIVAAAARGRAPAREAAAPPLVPAAAAPLLAVLAAACAFQGFFRPAAARIFLKKAGLALSLSGEEEALRSAYRAIRLDPLFNPARKFLLRRLLAAGDYDGARRILQEAARVEPENPELRSDLGMVHSAAGNPEAAAAAYRRAVEIDHGSSNLPRYYARLIEAEAAAGDGKAARKHLKAALARDISVISRIHWETAPVEGADRDDLYLDVGDTGEALHLDAVLEERYADLREAARAGRPQDRYDWFSLCQAFQNVRLYDRALAVLDEMEGIFGGAEAAVIRFHRAEVERTRNNLDRSDRLFTLAENIGDRTNPGAAEFYRSRRGRVLLEQGRFDEAVELFRSTLAELRDYRNYGYAFRVTLDGLLHALDETGRTAEKIRPLRQRLFFCDRLNEYPPLLAELAEACAAAGRTEEAERTAARFLAVTSITAKRLRAFEDDALLDTVRKTAFLLADRWRERGLAPEAALARAWRLTDFYSPKPGPTLFRYFFLSRLGLLERAWSVLELARMDREGELLLLRLALECSQMRDDPEALRKLLLLQGRTLRDRGVDLDGRTRALVEFLTRHPKDAPSVVELVRTLLVMFRFDHAVNAVKAARRFLPGNGELEWLAARALRLDGKPEAALEALRRAEVTDPRDHRFRYARENLGRHLADGRAARPGGGP